MKPKGPIRYGVVASVTELGFVPVDAAHAVLTIVAANDFSADELGGRFRRQEPKAKAEKRLADNGIRFDRRRGRTIRIDPV